MHRKWLTILTAVYALLILYGSLMPWEFAAASQHVSEHWDRAFTIWPLGHGPDNHRSDELENFVFYVPLGLLAGLRRRLGGGWAIGAVAVGALSGAVLSATVEWAQLYTAARISAMSDLILNTAGSAAGALLGVSAGPKVWRSLSRWVDAQRPNAWALAATALLIALATDATCPWVPRLAPNEIWHGLKAAAQLSLGAGLDLHTADDWLVKRVGVYCVLALLLAAWRPADRSPAWLRGAVLAAAFAAAAECGKILFSTFNIANVALSCAGAVAALALGPTVVGKLSTKHKLSLLWLAVLAFVVHSQWRMDSGGLDFAWSEQMMSRKWPQGAGWLPLYQGATKSRPEDLFNFVALIFLAAALAATGRVYAARLGYRGLWSSPARAAFWAGTLGLVLELGQFLVPGRHPTTGDILCFAVGGAVGSLIAGRLMRASPAQPSLGRIGPQAV